MTRNGVYASGRGEPKTMGMTAVAEVPTDLTALSALADEYPGLGLRLVRRIAYERRVGVYRVGGKVLVSRAEFADFIRAGRIEPTAS